MGLKPPVIEAGTSIFNAGLQFAQNIGNRKFAREMYNTQRADALADWNMQNLYNSPAEQMKRFTDAGLNKNLIYGQTTPGSVVRSSDFKQPNTQAPQIENAVGKYFNIKMQQQQLDNLQKQNELLVAQTENINSKTSKQNFDLGFNNEVRANRVEQQMWTTRNVATAYSQAINNLNLSDQKFDINRATLAKLVAETSRILADKSRIDIDTWRLQKSARAIDLDNILREMEIKLRDSGASWRDGIVQRNVFDVVHSIFQQMKVTPGRKF